MGYLVTVKEKTCPNCKINQSVDRYCLNSCQKDGLSTNCKSCDKKWREERKRKIIAYYSNNLMCCNKCGFNDCRALCIDHIDGKGNEHRRKIKNSHFYNWLTNNNYPEGFQVLCANCNLIKVSENEEFGLSKKRIEHRNRVLNDSGL